MQDNSLKDVRKTFAHLNIFSCFLILSVLYPVIALILTVVSGGEMAYGSDRT